MTCGHKAGFIYGHAFEKVRSSRHEAVENCLPIEYLSISFICKRNGKSLYLRKSLNYG